MTVTNERTNLDVAYEALKADMGPGKYAELLQALEDALREEGNVWIPGSARHVEGVLKDGRRQFAWCLVNGEQGPLLVLYTSQGQLAKRKSAEDEIGVAVRLSAPFDFIRENVACAGIVINPQDNNGGIVVPRTIVNQIRDNAAAHKGYPRIPFDMLPNVLFALWGNAENVPVMVMTVNEEVDAVGGLDRLVNPIVELCEKYAVDNSAKGRPLEQFVSRAMAAAYDDAVSAGVMVHVDKSVFDSKTPDEWVRYQYEEEDEDEVEDVLIRVLGLKDGPFSDCRVWEDARRANIRKYLEIFEAKVGLAFKCESKEQVYRIFAANIGIVIAGMMLFGLGYGAAIYAASRGPEEIRRVTELQRRYLTEG